MKRPATSPQKRRVSETLATSEGGAWSWYPGSQHDLTQKIVLALIDGHDLKDRGKRFAAAMNAIRGDAIRKGNPPENDHPYFFWMAEVMLRRQTRAGGWGTVQRPRPVPEVNRLAVAAVFYFDFWIGRKRDADPWFNCEPAERNERASAYLKSAAKRLVGRWKEEGEPLIGLLQRGPDEEILAEADALQKIQSLVVPLGVKFSTDRLATD